MISSDQFELRRNFYFFASDGSLPFDRAWGQCICL
jgi:hypothetical protein